MSSLKDVLASIEKRFGKESLSGNQVDVEFVSSGIISLDIIMGGGFAKGRIAELYGWESSGKSTIALMLAAQVQKLGKAVGYIDMEHAMDMGYANNLGVDTDKDSGKWVMSQPDNGEEALEITRELLKAEEIGLIVIDSVTALVPKAVLLGEAGDSKMGLQARLMSQMLPTMTAPARKSGCIILFINQLREKIGVVYGCMHVSTVLHTTEGMFEFGKIVNKKENRNIISYDEPSNSFKEFKIENHYKNGLAVNGSDFLNLKIESYNKLQYQTVKLTKDHEVLTNNGWKKAKDLLPYSDKLISYVDNTLSYEQEQILIGSLLGDGSISRRNNLSYYFNTECKKQINYFNWKKLNLKNLFSDKLISKSSNMLQKYYFQHYENKFSVKIKNKVKSNKFRCFDEEIINKIDLLALAIWFLDDGSADVDRGSINGVEQPRITACAQICMKRLRHLPIEDSTYLMDLLVNRVEKLGYKTYHKIRGADVNLVFDLHEFKKFSYGVREYVHPEMQYKLLQFDRGYFNEKIYNSLEIANKDKIFINLLQISPISEKDSLCLGLYDIQTECSTYMVGSDKKTNGIVVHNSPTTTTGGNALKFYASQRLEIAKIGQNKDGEEVLSNQTRVKVTKNKVAPPFMKTEFNVEFGTGVDIIKDLVDVGVNLEVLKRGGSWYSYGDTKLGQGMEKTKETLADNPELVEEIKDKIFEQLEK